MARAVLRVDLEGDLVPAGGLLLEPELEHHSAHFGTDIRVVGIHAGASGGLRKGDLAVAEVLTPFAFRLGAL